MGPFLFYKIPMEPKNLTIEQLMHSYEKLLEAVQYYAYAFDRDGMVDSSDLEEMTLSVLVNEDPETFKDIKALVGGKHAREVLVELSNYYSPGEPHKSWLL